MNPEAITFRTDHRMTTDEFIGILNRSTLGERRPVNDLPRMKKMLDAFTIHITAWQGDEIVGAATAWTDYAFSCYLADLAVDVRMQKSGIGRELVKKVREEAGPQTTLILISAPAAMNYYPKIGMEKFGDCFLIRRVS